MTRLFRSFVALVLAAAFGFFMAAPAAAEEPGPRAIAAAPPSPSPAPATQDHAAELVGSQEAGASVSPPKEPAPTLSLPSDVPLVLPGQVAIPRVPADYVVSDRGWLKLAYPPAASERMASVIASAEGVRAELASIFGQSVLDAIEVRIVPSVSVMRELAPIGAPPPSYASGVAYPRLHLVLISMLAPRGGEAIDLDQVFRHELAHVALEDAVAGQHVPAWFNEGFAVLFAGENGLDRQKVLWSAALSGTLLPLADLDRGFPSDHFDVNIAYAESADFVGFLRRHADELRFAGMIGRVRTGQSFDRALGSAYASDLRKLEFQWRSDVERRYSIIPVLAGGGLLWVGVIGALGWGWHKKRVRAKAILARWAKEEAIEDALLAERLAASRDDSVADLTRVGAAARASASKVEHRGRWHTVH